MTDVDEHTHTAPAPKLSHSPGAQKWRPSSGELMEWQQCNEVAGNWGMGKEEPQTQRISRLQTTKNKRRSLEKRQKKKKKKVWRPDDRAMDVTVQIHPRCLCCHSCHALQHTPSCHPGKVPFFIQVTTVPYHFFVSNCWKATSCSH